MQIYLIRHGETEFNKEQRYQGSMDIPLSLQGRSKLCQADLPVGRVYTSHMRRTVETAELIFPGAQTVPVRDLREMSFGVYEGRSRAELSGDPLYESWLSTGFAGDCPGTEERHTDFVARTCRAFSALVDQALEDGEERLVIVAHGGTQMAVLSAFADEERPFGAWLTGNGAGYILDSEKWILMRKLTVADRVSYSQ